MPKLPRPVLEKRLDNEESELAAKGYKFTGEDLWKEQEVATVAGRDRVSVARRYEVSLRAKGFMRREKNVPPTEFWDHEAWIYVLDSYPFPSDRSKLGAPFRITWLTPIFHPNISPGIKAGDEGIVCWELLKQWKKLDTLYGIVKGTQLLVEHPYTLSPLRFEICRDAALWFDRNKAALEGPKILREVQRSSYG